MQGTLEFWMIYLVTLFIWTYLTNVAVQLAAYLHLLSSTVKYPFLSSVLFITKWLSLNKTNEGEVGVGDGSKGS